LWVLARNVEDFFTIYDEDVIAFLDKNGFDYIKVEQNC
jgi:hypothetical protein